MLMGEYEHSIDSKGRLIIPSKIRSEIGTTFIITRGLDGCLFGYPMNEWRKVEEKINQLPVSKKSARSFSRFLFSAADESKIDSQGRVNIPDTLLNYAEIDKKCVIVGVSTRIEIWSKDKWDEFSKTAGEEFDDIAEDLIDF
ncbi:division/cell wall cluster transcriptional repressor MraZ [Apilactobacillus apinorum]|uniref:Transcriptional regulator MraZ n=1 Tax=Apilactobacillus apinorum TaxID=1218495 RepID=A0ABP9ZFY6_9LACO|nr:division/cell wall cluster transcriptional repressor MraZ [Apilactobacillus apinorum]KOY68667.1 Protein MraZ [Apilactobacillus apinorum]CAI2682012.1 mraZ Protein MraZ [Apilactobacillus apinorum]